MKIATLSSAMGLMAAASTDSPTPSGAAAKAVKVEVIINSLNEDGVVYAKGETFETTAERAKALGDCVKTLK